MGLIKSNNAPAAAVPFSMRDIENQARAILARAQQRGEQLLAAAMAEAEEIKKAARVEGLAEGRKEGLAKGAEEGRKAGQQAALAEQKVQLANLVKALAQAAQQVDASRRQLESDALREVVELAVAVARRVTKRQAEIDPAVLEANLAEAMKLVVGSADLRIALHPSQRQALRDALPKLQLTWPALQHAELVEDASVGVGGCRVHTRGGLVDADVDAQLDRIVADLLPPPADPNDGAGPAAPAP